MTVKMANNAVGHLAMSISTNTTTVLLVAEEAGLFPVPTGGAWYPITVTDGIHSEIMKVTARSAETLTVVRGQEGTSGTAFVAGAIVELRMTAAVITDMQNATTAAQAEVDALSTSVTADIADLQSQIDDKASTAALASVESDVTALEAADVVLQTNINAKVAKAGDTMTGDLRLSKANVATPLYFRGQKTGADRWTMTLGDGTAEGGSNAGSDFTIARYDDAGNKLDDIFKITRSTGAVTIDPVSGTAILALDKIEGQAARLDFTKGGLRRFSLSTNNGAESGSNAGSDFTIGAYDDSGTLIRTVFQITRSTGLITADIANPVVFGHRNGAGDVSTGAGGTWVKVNINTMSPNVGGWTLSSNSLIVPKTGIYMICASAQHKTAASIGACLVGFSTGATSNIVPIAQARIQQQVAATGTWTFSVTRHVSLTAGDAINLLAFNSVSGGNIGDPSDSTFLSVQLVAAQ